MDDECVEVLGRPISSLKVAELRDELTKRALIKTGNKKELVDRLRLAIQRQSTPQQSNVADLTIRQIETNNAEEAVIDYSSPEKQQKQIETEHSIQPTVQEQRNEPVVVDYSSHEKKNDLVDEEKPSETLLSQEQEEEQPKTIDQDEVVSASIEDKTPIRENAEDDEPVGQPDKTSDHIDQSREKLQESIPEVVGKSDTEVSKESDTEVAGKTDTEVNNKIDSQVVHLNENPEVEDEKPMSYGQSQRESELSSQVPFTLKRRISDLKDGSGSSKNEKKRKWSGKSDPSKESPPNAVLSGGISSQKLQELIELKQAESASAPPPTAVDSTENHEKDLEQGQEKPEVPSNIIETRHDNNNVEINSKNDDSIQQAESTVESNSINDKHEDTISTEQNEDKPGEGLLVENLVRPFTLMQLKEVLTKFGPIIEDKFWTNKVKSKCCVLYESVDIAQQTKVSLDGQHWPISNPKTLKVTFITEAEFNDHINSDVAKPKESVDATANGAEESTGNKSMANRLGERAEETDIGTTGPVKKRLGEKVAEASTKSSHINRDGDNSQPQELDDLFRKTKSKPPLFWLPLGEEQAEFKQKERLDREARKRNQPNKTSSSRRSPPLKRRPHARRSPPRHKSPARKHRSSPGFRSPKRHSPPPMSPPLRKRSPGPSRRSPGPMRRPNRPISRSPGPIRRSPGVSRRSPGPTRRSPRPTRRSPGPIRRSPGPIRRSPGPIRRSPGPIQRSPGPMRRSPGPIRRSPGPMRRSPGPMRRSPGPTRRSPGLLRRSPGPIRRSPGPIRRSPGPIRRSPGPIRRSPGPIRRSPGPIRRSPGPIRRSPMRRSPGPIRRSPMLSRRSPAPVRTGSPMRRRSRSISRSRSSSRSPIRRKSPLIRRRTPPRYAMHPEQEYPSDSRRIQRSDRLR